MKKGYWIAHVDVTDPEGYKEYVRLNALAFAKFGGRFLVRGGTAEMRQGSLKPRHVVIEFPSFAEAKACYDSPEYKAALAARESAGSADMVIIEGHEG